MVVGNEDPNNAGRLRVRIGGLHDGIDDADLPWASASMSSASFNSGSFIIPDIGDTVWVVFEDGRNYVPVWIGCCYSSNTTMGRRHNSRGYTNNAPAGVTYAPTEGVSIDKKVIYKSKNGAIVYCDDSNSDDSIVLKDANGNKLVLGAQGMYTVVPGGGTLRVLKDGTISLRTDNGTIRITPEGKIEMESENLNIDDKGLEAKVGTGVLKLDESGFNIKSDGAEVSGTGSSMTLTSGGASLVMSGGVVTVNGAMSMNGPIFMNGNVIHE